MVITSYNRLEAEDDEDVLLKLLKLSGAGEEADKLAVDNHCVWGVEKNQHQDESRRKSTHQGEFLTDNAYWMCFIGFFPQNFYLLHLMIEKKLRKKE